MSIDPDLRIALGFLLLVRGSMEFFQAWGGRKKASRALAAPDNSVLSTQNGNRGAARVVWGLLLIPIIIFLVDPFGIAWLLSLINLRLGDASVMQLPDLFRWAMLVPAVAGLLLQLMLLPWHDPAHGNEDSPQGELDSSHGELDSLHGEFDARGAPQLRGPRRLIRFPHWTADLLLFGPLLLATDNWLAVAAWGLAILVLKRFELPQAERGWQNVLGSDYAAYAAGSGQLLPHLPASRVRSAHSYSVPKRFGLAAIIGLTTMFALLFGAINAIQARISEIDLTPGLHIYFGLQLMVIWVGQMQFGQAPRRVSVLFGAILLPAFVRLQFQNALPGWVIYVALAVIGAAIGYVLGALAAGLFLFIDWVGATVSGSRAHRGSASDRVSP